MQKNKDSAPTKEETPSFIWILYGLLVVSIIFYAVDNNTLVGLLVFALIVITLVIEFKYSLKNAGAKKTIMEIGATLGVVVAFWVVLVVLLQTTAPIDVVSSCSMLPILQRGDIVFLHGIGNVTTFLSDNHVPVVDVSTADYNAMLANMYNEDLAFYPYVDNNKSRILGNQYVPKGVDFSVGLYNFECLNTYIAHGDEQYLDKCYLSDNPASNLIKYNYSISNIKINNTNYTVVYTSSVTINGRKIVENYSNPIIVYKTVPTDLFYAEGDIIHRAFAAIKAGNNYYILTKGDNNPSMDVEVENLPAASNDLLGYTVGPSIPLIGYMKLIISGQIVSPAGCNKTIQHTY